jgi:serine O-acetyltransferase
MKFSEYRYLVLSDLYRIAGQVSTGVLVRQVLLGESYKYIFWMRTCRFTESKTALRYALNPLARMILRRLKYKLGISIRPSTRIGSGFYIGHFGGIVINENCIIGKNCNISPGVNLGKANRGERRGYPTVGDNVYIGPGAKLVGAIRIGNNVAIGANAVVTEDVPDNAVVAGIPARIVSHNGAQGYINRTDYDEKIVYPIRS